MENKSLISVVVFTYNSEKYICDTLNSVYSQDYERIELIVSDDGSKDSTCDLVENWMASHKQKFESCTLIKSFKNRGTCANYNQGVYNSHGEYIKTLDGDDILYLPTALSDYLAFINNNKLEICISDVEVFSTEEYDLPLSRKVYEMYFSCVKESLQEQKKRINKELRIPDPGLFFSRRLYNEVDGFDEKYKLQEEWPFFMKVLDKNYHIGALDNKLVGYRLASTSATNGKVEKSAVKKICIKDNLDFFLDKRLKRLLREKEYALACNQLYTYIRMYLKQII